MGGEGQTDAGGAVEDHEPHAILRAEYGQRLVRRRGHLLHVGLHAAAHVEQQDHVHGHLFVREVADFADAAGLAQDEVLGGEAADSVVLGVDHLDVDARQIHVAAERDLVLRPERGRQQCEYSQFHHNCSNPRSAAMSRSAGVRQWTQSLGGLMSKLPLPFGHHTVNPYLIIPDPAGFLAFAAEVFGATEIERLETPDGAIRHAEALLGDSLVMMGQASAEWPAQTAGLYVYVDDTDAAYEKALAAGATSILAPADQPYGHRNAGVRDANGITWWIATYVEAVPVEELKRRLGCV